MASDVSAFAITRGLRPFDDPVADVLRATLPSGSYVSVEIPLNRFDRRFVVAWTTPLSGRQVFQLIRDLLTDVSASFAWDPVRWYRTNECPGPDYLAQAERVIEVAEPEPAFWGFNTPGAFVHYAHAQFGLTPTVSLAIDRPNELFERYFDRTAAIDLFSFRDEIMRLLREFWDQRPDPVVAS